MMTIPFAKVSLAGNEEKYVSEVLASGWLTTCSKALSFERLFAQYVGAKYACAVNSCTAALHLAVEAIGIKRGDKVLVPSLTFTASADIIRFMDAEPIFMDVEYDTRLVSPRILKKALDQNPDVKAIVLVHYGGQAHVMHTADHEGIVDICRSRNIKIIEDAAHAFPTKFQNKYIGSFGDVTCFSFYANKTITTGEGGMLVTDNEEIYNRVKIMRLHGISRDVWARFTTNPASWEYDVVAPGFKYNMPDINAAVGLAQLEKADYFRDRRQHCAEFYFKELKKIPVLDLPVCMERMEDHSWHLFPVVLKPESPVSRNEFIELMSKRGIGTSVHYKPLHRMTYFQQTYLLKPEDFPNTERIWKGTVSLPIYPKLTQLELIYICRNIKELLIPSNKRRIVQKTLAVQKVLTE
jgi:dTDP-4-amino-4,6-dideoxygalactose transaminase